MFLRSRVMKDPRISEIFYYFEQHTTIASGRTVGRKIGTVQEILVRKLLQTDRRILRSVVYEPRIQGKSRATHKVEFVFFQPVEVRVVAEKQSIRFDALPDLAVTKGEKHDQLRQEAVRPDHQQVRTD